MMVKVYVDGACGGNPGPGGWAALLVYEGGCKHITGYELDTTNNAMELVAVIEVMKYIVKTCKELKKKGLSTGYQIFSDSGYVINAINGRWYTKWSHSGWLTSVGEPVKNKPIWEKFMEVKSELAKLDVGLMFTKVKGHSGNQFNEMVDGLAKREVVRAREAIKCGQ